MWRIGIFENENDDLSCQIAEALANQKLDVLYINKNGVKTMGNSTGTPIVVISFNCFNTFSKSVVDVCVIAPETKFDPNVCSCLIVVAPDSCSPQTLSSLNSKSVITFGVSSRSTITVSSLTDNEAVLSLQREIVDLNGRRICEQEFSEKLDYSGNVDTLMSSAAVLILAGVSIESINSTAFVYKSI